MWQDFFFGEQKSGRWRDSAVMQELEEMKIDTFY